MATPMPTRLPRLIEANNSYILVDFIGKSDDYIKNSTFSPCLLVNYDDLVQNIDLFKRILEVRKESVQINCADYESALLIERVIDTPLCLALVDDYKNMDRSYIDTTLFKKHKFSIPLSYVMWNPIINGSCNVSCLRIEKNDYMTSNNGNKTISKETIDKVKEIVLKFKNIGSDDIEKCMIIANFLQENVQFVEGIESDCAGKTYIVEAPLDDVTSEKVGSVESVLFHNYGLCAAISNTSVLLLNNPIMNVNIRGVFGYGHQWNVINMNGQYYYIDNTWCITRNNSKVPGALKALDFSSEYLFFGNNMADAMGHHDSLCYSKGPIQENNLDKGVLEEAKKKLLRKMLLGKYSGTLAFPSKIKE